MTRRDGFGRQELGQGKGQGWEVLVKARSSGPPASPSCTETHTETRSLPPLYHVPLHICHSGNQKREGGIELWKKREGGTQQTINCVAGWRGRKTEREREGLQNRGRERGRIIKCPQ